MVIKMKKILIIGSPGSGKSTLAVQLAEQLNLPLIHLDKLNWVDDNNTLKKTEFDLALAEVLNKEQWIIEGNYNRTLSKRVKYADTIIWLDLPRVICIWGILKRYLKGKLIKQQLHGNPNKLEQDFLKFVWNFKNTDRAVILKILKESNDKNIIILKNHQDKENFKNKISLMSKF